MKYIRCILITPIIAMLAITVVSASISRKEYSPERYYGEIIFKDGRRAQYFWISNYCFGEIVGGWECDSIRFSGLLMSSVPNQWIYFSRISRIDVVDLNEEEIRKIEEWEKQSKGPPKERYEGILKTKITFLDGTAWEKIYLYPSWTGFKYEGRYEEGKIDRTVASVTFNLKKEVKVCPDCSREYIDLEWEFCPYDGIPLEPESQ